MELERMKENVREDVPKEEREKVAMENLSRFLKEESAKIAEWLKNRK